MSASTTDATSAATATMRAATWQALPPRHRGRRSEAKGNDGNTQLKKRKAIEDNVEARAAKSAAGTWAEATLDGKDGCAGEFYEYLDHTADVQCHSWGPSLEAAFESMAPCMFNYMTDLTLITENPGSAIEFTARGHDCKALLFNYMDELLFRFCTDGLCVKRVQVLDPINVKDDDRGLHHNRDTTTGGDMEEEDSAAKPEMGGELKLRVRVHGCTFDRNKHVQGTEIKAITYSNMQIHKKEDRCDLFVIVDI